MTTPQNTTVHSEVVQGKVCNCGIDALYTVPKKGVPFCDICGGAVPASEGGTSRQGTTAMCLPDPAMAAPTYRSEAETREATRAVPRYCVCDERARRLDPRSEEPRCIRCDLPVFVSPSGRMTPLADTVMAAFNPETHRNRIEKAHDGPLTVAPSFEEDARRRAMLSLLDIAEGRAEEGQGGVMTGAAVLMARVEASRCILLNTEPKKGR